jgi:hypothetical protein
MGRVRMIIWGIVDSKTLLRAMAPYLMSSIVGIKSTFVYYNCTAGTAKILRRLIIMDLWLKEN